MAAGLDVDVEPGERLGAAESKARWARIRKLNAQILRERAEQQRQLAAAERKRSGPPPEAAQASA